MKLDCIIAYLLLAGLCSCKPQLQVTKMDLPTGQTTMPVSATNDAGGMYYPLPLSIITIDVPITKIERSKAECFDKGDSFTKSLLPEVIGIEAANKLIAEWENPKNKDTYTSYKLHTNEITIGTRPAPDPNKVYYATLKNKWNKNQQLTLNLNELGQLTKGEFVNEDRTFDLIVQGVNSIAGIVSAILPAKSATGVTPSLADQVISYGVNVCQKKKEDLLEVRAARFDMIKDKSHLGDGVIFKQKLEELDALEKVLIANLTFDETKTKAVLHLDILMHTADDVKNIELFRFDPAKGIKILAKPQPGTYQNEYLSYFVDETIPADAKTYYLTFDYEKGKQLADRVYQSGNSPIKPGIAYNVPVWVRGRVNTIKNGKNESPLAVAMLPMPQLGQVAYLPARASKVGFDLDPITGALRTISLQQTGLSADQIKAAGEAATAGVTAVKKPAAKTDLETIQNENALLEQQIKKINQQNKLDSLLGKQSRGNQ